MPHRVKGGRRGDGLPCSPSVLGVLAPPPFVPPLSSQQPATTRVPHGGAAHRSRHPRCTCLFLFVWLLSLFSHRAAFWQRVPFPVGTLRLVTSPTSPDPLGARGEDDGALQRRCGGRTCVCACVCVCLAWGFRAPLSSRNEDKEKRSSTRKTRNNGSKSRKKEGKIRRDGHDSHKPTTTSTRTVPTGNAILLHARRS